MAAYMIVEVETTDEALMAEYRKHTPALCAKFGGRFIVRGGKTRTLEGGWTPPRVVVIEFPDFEAAERVRVVVIERTGRRIGLAGDAELLQPGQELLEVLPTEVTEDVLPRDVLATPRDQPQDEGGHQRVVESADRAIRGRVSPRISHRGRRRGSPWTCRP